MAYQTKYPDIPRIDSHTHLVGRRQPDDIWPAIEAVRAKTLADSGIDVAAFIELDGGQLKSWNHQTAEGIERVKRGNGRIIPTLADYRPAQGLKASVPGDVKKWLNAGYCGWKWHWNSAFNGGLKAKYGLINDPYFEPYFAALEDAGMPLMCLHLEAPWRDPEKQRAALYSVMDQHPDLVVIQAHFGVQRHGTLKEHAALFRRYPNFHRDTSVTQHKLESWTDHTEVREFFIEFADRLLFGTDNMSPFKSADKIPVSHMAQRYALASEWLETANVIEKQGINKPRSPEPTLGLNLPREALEKIYWQNAVRLVPHVRDAMAALGYALPVGTPEKPAPEATARAQRLAAFLPRITERDMQSMVEADRAIVREQLSRIGGLIK